MTAAFPTGSDRRSPVSRPVLGGRDKRRERALWFLFTIYISDSKWRALRRCGDPGIDIPDSLPRTTRVGGLLRGTPPYLTPIPKPSAAFPTGLDRRSPVSRPVLGGRVKRKVRALCILFYYYNLMPLLSATRYRPRACQHVSKSVPNATAYCPARLVTAL